MKSRYLISAILGLGLSSQVWSQPAPAPAPAKTPAPAPSPAPTVAHAPIKAPVLKLPNDTTLKDGDRFIFIGDSITHQCQYTQLVEDFYYTRYPHLRVHFRNAGISGDRAQDVLNRWEEDIAAFKPTIATVLIGMNDGSYKDFDQETFDTYKNGMLEIMDRLDAMKCRVILMSPTMFDHQAFDQMVAADPTKSKGKVPTNYNALLAYYGKWAQEVARERGYAFADLYTPLNHITVTQRKKDANFTLIPDAIHPEADGQLIMAHSLLRDLGELRPIAQSGARREGKNWKAIKSYGIDLTQEVEAAGPRELKYTSHAKSLPWAVFDKAPLGAKLLRLAQFGTADFHIVDGLPAGRYDVFINGTKVETTGYRALAQRLNLAQDSESPNYQQALRVTELNKKRNEEAVKPLRNLWARQKGMRLRKETQPDVYEAWQKEFKEQRAKLETLADKYEAEIYEINQVKPQKVEIKAATSKKAA